MKKLIWGSLLVCLSALAQADDIKVFFNHPVDPPAQQADLEQKIIALINTANSTLDMAVYDLDLPGIANAMASAKARGVTVRFITDNDNTGADNAQALGILNNAGVPWLDDTANGSAGSHIQHNKFVIVDGEWVLTGSSNFTQSGIHGDLDANGNLISDGNDNHIVIIDSNQLATIYTNQFNLMWGDGPGGALDSEFGLGKPASQIQTAYTNNDHTAIDVQFTPQSPTVYQGSTLYNIQALLATAQTRIRVAQFVMSAQDLADTMQQREKAGVNIEGVGDRSFFSRYYSEFLDMLGEEKMNTKGVPETDSYTGAPNNPWTTPVDVRMANLKDGDMFHNKYLIVDNSVLTGSHNLSGSAAFSNDENIVIIHDAQTASEFEGHFDYAYCKASYASNCAKVSNGTWEGVSFTAAQVSSILNMVNTASLTELDVNAALNKTAAQNIVNARPITSMDQLAAVYYVGGSAMQALKNYLSTWNSEL